MGVVGLIALGSFHKSSPDVGQGKRPDVGQAKRAIHSHIREFEGIVDTIYGSTSADPNYTTYGIGKHASHYLQAHGYTKATITDIVTIWSASGTPDEFLDHLVPRGMPATEVQWLWDLIRHDDNCGF